MIESIPEKEAYLSSFAELERRERAAPEWLRALRRRAIERFGELGFPTTRMEDWQYTNVAPLARLPLRPAPHERAQLSPDRLREFTFPELDCFELVFVNGRHAPELSSIPRLPDGATVQSLADALESGAPVVERALARHAGFEDQAFAALNTAFAGDGAVVHLPKGTVLATPIHLVYVSNPRGGEAVSHPRTLILADEGCQVKVVESFSGPEEAVYFTNAVTEIVLGDRAIVDYCRLDQEGKRAYHVSTVAVRQRAGSRFTSHAIALGSLLARNQLDVRLEGEGAECSLQGLYLAAGEQHIDNHTSIDHVRPHCTSHEIYKGILDGRASGVFNGRIVVRPDAQKTVARQTNKNLLLSEDAVVNTKPQLEIRADDVKCSHGATIGQLDPMALFYLQSRGIGRAQARNLLINAFGSEIIEAIAVKPLQCQLDLAVVTRLSRAHREDRP